MTRALLLVLLCSTGCLVVPKETTTTRMVSTDSTAAWQPGKPSAPVIQARLDGDFVQIWAVAPRECMRKAMEVHEIRHAKVADLEVDSAPGSLPGQAAILAVVLVPVVVVSGIVTAIAVAADKPRIERITVPAEQRTSCPVMVPDVRVGVFWMSGATTSVVTDRDGRVQIMIPDTEPLIGAVTVIGDGVTRTIAYDRRTTAQLDAERQRRALATADLSTIANTDHESCTKARSIAMREAQDIRDLQERTKALLALPDCAYHGP